MQVSKNNLQLTSSRGHQQRSVQPYATKSPQVRPHVLQFPQVILKSSQIDRSKANVPATSHPQAEVVNQQSPERPQDRSSLRHIHAGSRQRSQKSMKPEDLHHFTNNFQKIYQAKQSINSKQLPQRKKNETANLELVKRGLVPQFMQSVQAPKGLLIMDHSPSKPAMQGSPDQPSGQPTQQRPQ